MPRRVLVVDDDPAIRHVIATALADEGYEVVTAANGQEAMEQIHTQPPSAVLLDLNMPVMNGWELTAQVQASGLPVPLVFMTAGDRARAEAARHQVAGYLSKPFDLSLLLDCVEQVAGPPSSDS